MLLNAWHSLNGKERKTAAKCRYNNEHDSYPAASQIVLEVEVNQYIRQLFAIIRRFLFYHFLFVVIYFL